MAVAVVSQSIPPDITGQGMALSALTSDVDCRFVRTPPIHAIRRPTDLLSVPLKLARQARGASLIVGCTGGPLDLLAIAAAASMLRIPFVAHLFDDPVEQWASRKIRRVAGWAERIWARRAKAVIVPNERLLREFANRRSIVPMLVRNPVDAVQTSVSEWPSNPGEYRIVYTGSIYQAQADSLRRLSDIMGRLGKNWSLHIYSPQRNFDVAELGILGSQVFTRGAVNHEEARQRQYEADILFLPLSFQSRIQSAINSAAPMKLGEYLATGRPILAHVPADSFVAEHLKRERAAAVVTEPNVDSLYQGLRSLVSDAHLRSDIVANASRLAGQYSLPIARRAYRDALSL